MDWLNFFHKHQVPDRTLSPESVYIMFYNLENLYDCKDDPKTNDDDFTPDGKMKWTTPKYYRKLSNIAEVISQVRNEFGQFPALVGVSEIENDKVLADLISQNGIRRAGYRFKHYESGDERGVDVGLLYDPSRFKMEGSDHIKLRLRNHREFLGRDILVVWGMLEGERFIFYVCHWPSRRGDVAKHIGFRRAGAETVRDHSKELQAEIGPAKVVVMGDMNDEPGDDSLKLLLGACEDMNEVREGGFYNPFFRPWKFGYGSSLYRGKWKMFDNIIVNDAIVRAPESELGISMIGGHHSYGMVYSRRFLLHKNGTPKRSFDGVHFNQNGFSDHLPVLIRLDRH
ncbi:MAG: endonuclease/exonuclease/phosphatase family protein [Bacteroidales bacterium]|jgi:predicted extracellular nuclease|nr:endonuclease/exonuclease/phosphatase family protein [Bacteroidales bacterium]MCI2122450.1 endonuclease/exonuclease/phosphatase family protein [Bacteroidales bacterium]MCI2145106.1 endonuclease/exonuclease/phosphatase family protein [Bacteroidales bacterium]